MGEFFRKSARALVLVGLWVLAAGAAEKTPPPELLLLHAPFTSGMVLQRDVPAPVWGWAAPDDKVTVTLKNAQNAEAGSYGAKADASGRWQVKVGPFPAGGPYTLEVASGKTRAVLRDVLFGDVWLCSGQANMEMGITGARNGAAEAAAGNFPQIRLLTVRRKINVRPQADGLDQAWRVCTPANLLGGGWGGFSACAYFFGREMFRQTRVPVGLIHASWAESRAEPWVSEEALLKDEVFRPVVQKFIRNRELWENKSVTYIQRVDAWWAENDPVGQPAVFAKFEPALWKTMTLPALWENAGLADYDGIVWFRRVVKIPENWAGRELVLSLGPIDDCDTTFVNGLKVGGMNIWNAPRVYKVPAGVVRPGGENVIAVRVLDTNGWGGIYGTASQMSLRPADDSSAEISLAGAWQYRAAAEMKSLRLYPAELRNDITQPCGMYNAMIAPLTPLALRGVVWYQGEANASDYRNYSRLLALLIKDWRERFTAVGGKLPFGMVMLAGYKEPSENPQQDGIWARLREAQLQAARALPDVGIASAVDLGDVQEITPDNKQEVGRRLALYMLHASGQQKNIAYSGPVFTGAKFAEGKAVLTFECADGGLKSLDGKDLRWFAIAGADKRFYPARAVIAGETVMVAAPEVPEPLAVRYAWANNPDGANLGNGAGLPALPFRTDDWAPAHKRE